MIRNLIIFILVVFVAALLFTDNINFSNPSHAKALGKVVEINGTLMGKHPFDNRYFNLKKGAPIYKGSRLVSGFASQAQIHFGVPFRIEENSSLRLDEKSGHLEVHLLAGTLHAEQTQLNTQFFVNGQRVTSSKIASESKPQLTNLDIEKMPDKKLNEFYQKDQELQKNLRQTFKLHQRFMEKCFIKHYERRQGDTKSGTIMVSFQLLGNGRISDTKVKSSDFKDDEFHRCIIEVVSRARLKYYQGESKTVDFPIQVHLP